ncbi:DNA-binding protein [Nonomuraea sp. M3C6]|uniref:DNA-binding protein n=1 Tax=Nonomuraea marmarensis TaxID=3351344 RepID=A0ABW7A5X6_9ACTN
MARHKLSHAGNLVLDREGLTKLLEDHQPTVALVAEARGRGMDVLINALAIVEAAHRRTDQTRLAWLLSGLRISPISDKEAKAASTLLIGAGLHGHKYAIDAAIAEMAVRQQRPVVMLTSDIDDMKKLCGDPVRLIGI